MLLGSFTMCTHLLLYHCLILGVTLTFISCENSKTRSPLEDMKIEVPDDRQPLDAHLNDIDQLPPPDLLVTDMMSSDATVDMIQDQEIVRTFPNIEFGHPLNPEVGLYPYPSDYFLKESNNTQTGYLVHIPETIALPNLPAEAFAQHDGFSRLPMILSAWPRGVSQDSLPSPIDHGQSLLDQSTTLLIEHGTLRRIPHLAEVDLTSNDPLKAALIIRPVTLLKPNQSYTVVIQRGLTDADGQEYSETEAFLALKQGELTGFEPLDRTFSSFDESKNIIERSGLDIDNVILTWQFHTRSREQVTSALLEAQEQAAQWSLGDFIISEEREDNFNRIVQGEIDSPNFVGENGLEFDEQGQLIILGISRHSFSMAIPKVITMNEPQVPRPIIIYGHGFLGSHDQATRSSFNDLCVQGQFSAIGLKFGVYDELLPDLIRGIGGDLQSMRVLRAKVLQTMVNYTVMTRYIEELSQLYPELDPQRVYYMGISNGGTFGYLYAATSMIVEKAVMVVGGGGLAHFLQRATQWNGLGNLVSQRFPNPLKLQLYLALLQEQLDPIDPINYIDHLIAPRFEGRLPLRAQLHIAINDSQVHNLVSEWVARSAGIPLLTPSPKDIWGLDTLMAPLSNEESLGINSALIVYDEMVTPYPGGNLPPLEDNGTHGTVRRLPTYKQHIIDFLEEGRIQQICSGPCDPN